MFFNRSDPDPGCFLMVGFAFSWQSDPIRFSLTIRSGSDHSWWPDPDLGKRKKNWNIFKISIYTEQIYIYFLYDSSLPRVMYQNGRKCSGTFFFNNLIIIQDVFPSFYFDWLTWKNLKSFYTIINFSIIKTTSRLPLVHQKAEQQVDL